MRQGAGAGPPAGVIMAEGPRRPSARSVETGTGAAGCRGWPASWGDHGRGPAATTVPERWRPVPVRQGAGAGPPAGVIMAGGQRRPRFPSVGDRCRYGRVTELTRQLG